MAQRQRERSLSLAAMVGETWNTLLKKGSRVTGRRVRPKRHLIRPLLFSLPGSKVRPDGVLRHAGEAGNGCKVTRVAKRDYA